MPDIITSVSNPRVKHIVQLRQRGKRDREGLTIIEGEREIGQALDAGVEIREFFWHGGSKNSSKNKFFSRLSSLKTPVYETTSAVFKKMAYGDKEEGVLCLARIKPLDINVLPRKEKALYVLIESVEKPGNLGAILRSCDGAGVDGVIVCDPATDIYNPNVIRASLGAVFTLSVIAASNDKAYEFLKKNNVAIVATSPQAKTIYTQIDAKKPIALIVGSEMEGLSPFWLQKAQQTLRIPMKGRIDSLNVSASTAVVLYEINRQRST